MKASAKKIIKITSWVVLYVILAFGILAVLFTLTAKKSDYGAAQIFGYQMFTVESLSMEKNPNCDVSNYKIKSIPLHSLVFVEMKPQDEQELDKWYSSLEVGDVLSFRYRYSLKQQVIVTHRIVSITENSNGGYLIELKGDNPGGAATPALQTIDTSDKSIIGKVTGQSRILGALLFAIKQPVGATFIIILPCLIIILLEIFRIFSVFEEDKRKKLLLEQQSKDEEIERLKKRVSELETSSKGDQDTSENQNS